ncbi:hypothetical protein GCM10011514_25800 [Emticicia aquatilis]|uniref:Uncharacterized protein n=1 Tax=Emticicia aquatilis TaxID=1537369 RepID=A0A916YU86_9BACT|nr:hypothetical protein [Emticicia aquatilis]GGD60695.1 hypothetical protein GCM10011514_25800 [Emticicia aquatilis]
MKKIAIALIMFFTLDEAFSQSSYLSKTVKGSDYIEPYDRNAVYGRDRNNVYQALAERQRQFDKNVQTIRDNINYCSNEANKLTNNNDADIQAIGVKMGASITYLINDLNSNPRDYSNSNIFNNVIDRLNNIINTANKELKQLN